MQKDGKNMANTLVDFDILQRDLSCIWHPFTQPKTEALPIPISRAEGAYLYGFDGQKYFDAISSWWVNLHGHAHPYIVARLKEQLERLEQVVFADFTHEGGVALAENLLRVLKMEKGRVLYSDNGSTAVEGALKIALQYLHNTGKGSVRTRVICFENGYHGDTFGAMSAAGKNIFNRPFWPYMFQVESIPAPCPGQEEASIRCMKEKLGRGDAACFIFEPLVQASCGMAIHSFEVLNELNRLCQEHAVITIADEVMTGFGRTGNLFACDSLFCKPDIYCLSKGLSGGFLPLGATVCKESIFERFISDQAEHTLWHGHTYCGNALACACALASLELLEHPDCAAQRKSIEHQHRKFAEQWGKHPRLKRCEVAGTILVVEYLEVDKSESSYFSPLKRRLKEFFMKQQIFVRPIGNVLYLMPPYCSSRNDLLQAYQCIIDSFEVI